MSFKKLYKTTFVRNLKYVELNKKFMAYKRLIITAKIDLVRCINSKLSCKIFYIIARFPNN